MRIQDGSFFYRNWSRLFAAQNQQFASLATGKRILSAADDPAVSRIEDVDMARMAVEFVKTKLLLSNVNQLFSNELHYNRDYIKELLQTTGDSKGSNGFGYPAMRKTTDYKNDFAKSVSLF
ncbi:hypothetical protein [Effusibacillus dendaii]|uniref:Uncharacterized protein n=1 Tax=Effusibacillus dendaii TaxID=2743772 RepID=A0A7I8DD28_9BACL|nr:hypothetical protein [Effusibacillus dendaii]BCJ86726.1 hypothetical protein skT53_17110 [Effusibacillus dendaii]